MNFKPRVGSKKLFISTRTNLFFPYLLSHTNSVVVLKLGPSQVCCFLVSNSHSDITIWTNTIAQGGNPSLIFFLIYLAGDNGLYQISTVFDIYVLFHLTTKIKTFEVDHGPNNSLSNSLPLSHVNVWPAYPSSARTYKMRSLKYSSFQKIMIYSLAILAVFIVFCSAQKTICEEGGEYGRKLFFWKFRVTVT